MPQVIQKKKTIQKSQEKQEAKKPNKPEIITREFDAKGVVLGRLATQIADALRGKDKPTFRPHLLMGDKVVVKNASKVIITGNKLEQKVYYHHTGYLGNLKAVKMKDLMKKDPSDVLRRAVYGMLPKNKLRDSWMKNLEIEN